MQQDPYASGAQFSDEHHNKWGAPILIVGILLVLIGAGIFTRSLVQKNRTLETNEYFETQHNFDKYDERSQGVIDPSYQSSNEEAEGGTISEDSDNLTEVFSWEDFDTNLLGLDAQDGFEDALPKYSESIDLTGDGIPEAIFRGPSSNHDAVIILQRDSQGNVRRLEEQNTSGAIVPVYLFQVARAVVTADYDFLANGYYRVSRSLDENGRIFICDHFEVYVWNENQNMFLFSEQQTQAQSIEKCPHGFGHQIEKNVEGGVYNTDAIKSEIETYGLTSEHRFTKPEGWYLRTCGTPEVQCFSEKLIMFVDRENHESSKMDSEVISFFQNATCDEIFLHNCTPVPSAASGSFDSVIVGIDRPIGEPTSEIERVFSEVMGQLQ